MVNIEIDGKKIQAADGAMVIEAADAAGIYIPRFCYHKKLSVAANCRMCLVEVEKARKPLPACATPVTDGMKVMTRSPSALAAQKGVMEFLLINHPLDCPICDQGGECELQDVAMGYGKDVSRYTENKRVVEDKNVGPLIATDMTRCIHCTRCVRFGDEIAGVKELGATGRGEHMRIGTYVEATVDSELSGNVVDLCPVGALTSKPFRYSARAWEMQARPTIAGHDCVGSNLTVHVRGKEIMRVAPRENEQLNETWISDRDRYSYKGMESNERLTTPMVKQNGSWNRVDWETALRVAAEGLQKVVGAHSAEEFACVVSPSSTTEELYLAQKLTRGIGSNNIDSRLAQKDFSRSSADPVAPLLGQRVEDLENLDAALFIGSNIRKDQPILGHRVRKAALKGAKVSFINHLAHEMNYPVNANIATLPVNMLNELAAVASALISQKSVKAVDGIKALVQGVKASDEHQRIAESLLTGAKSSVVLGPHAIRHSRFNDLRSLANAIATMTNSTFGFVPAGANNVGAALVGALPHRGPGGVIQNDAGRNINEIFDKQTKAMLLVNCEPEFDCADGNVALAGVNGAEFIVAVTPFRSSMMETYANVLLPMGVFTETAGSFVNAEGEWQLFEGVTMPKGEARPAWKILRVLGNLLSVEGFDYLSVEEVHDEARSQIGEIESTNMADVALPSELGAKNDGLVRISDTPMYAIDGIVRRSLPLQKTSDAKQAAVYINSQTAEKLGLSAGDIADITQGDATITLPVIIDAAVPDGGIYVPAALAGTIELGDADHAVSVAKVSGVNKNEKVSAGNA